MTSEQPSYATVSSKTRRAILLLLALMAILGALGAAFSPYLLIEKPLLLLALAPEGRHMMLTTTSLALLPWLSMLVVRRTISMVASYGLGVLYGERMISWTERRFRRLGRLARWSLHWFKRIGTPAVALFPSYTISTLAGSTRMPLGRFILWLVVGQTLWFTALYFLGLAMSDVIQVVLAFIRVYLWESTVVCIALVALQQIYSRRRKKRGGLELPLEAHHPQ